MVADINATTAMLMMLVGRSGLTEATLGEIFDNIGISLDDCAENDCLNPCDGK